MFKKVLQRMLIIVVVVLGLLGILIGSMWLFSSKPAFNPAPVVAIHSPESGTTIRQGDTIAVNSTARDETQTITNVELWSYHAGTMRLIDESTTLEGKQSVSLSQGWQPFSLGEHRLIVRAINDLGNTGQAAIDLQVVEETGETADVLEFPTSPEGGFDPPGSSPEIPDPESDPSLAPDPDPDPDPDSDPFLVFPEFAGFLMEALVPFLEGTWVEVEALSFQVQEAYDEVYCYVGLQNLAPERVPETGSFTVSNTYNWNLANYLGGNNKAVVFVPDNESVSLYLDCMGLPTNSSLPVSVGTYTNDHPPADWTGQIIDGNSTGGDGFVVSYRINPEGGPLPAPKNLSQFALNNQTILGWTWQGDENEIDGFKIFRDNAHVATVQKNQRSTGIPAWWVVPPCEEQYQYTIVAYKEALQSAPSNSLQYQGDICGGDNGAANLTTQGICAGTGHKVLLDYRYQSSHGLASIRLHALKEGTVVQEIKSSKIQIQHGVGSAHFNLVYHGTAPTNTDQISVTFYDYNNLPFYVQVFDQALSWVPGSPDLIISSARVDRKNNQLKIQIKNLGCALPPVENPAVSIKRSADGWTGFLELEGAVPPRSQKLLTMDLDPNKMALWSENITMEVDPFDAVDELNENNNGYEIGAARIKYIQVYRIDVHNDHDPNSKGEWELWTEGFEVPPDATDWNLVIAPDRKHQWGTGLHDINNLYLNLNVGTNDSFGLRIWGVEDDLITSNELLGVVGVYYSADGNPVPLLADHYFAFMGSWKSGGEYSVTSTTGDYTIYYRIVLE